MLKLKYFYQITPIDNWEYWHKLDDTSSFELFKAYMEMEKICEKELKYEGICKKPGYGPYYTAIPGGGIFGTSVVIAFKQENNGTTYIGSEIDLSSIFDDIYDSYEVIK